MKKLLVICGPTATGKTSLALHLAKKLKGELISADSRQVYKGMDIGTGKNLPKKARFRRGYYDLNGVRLWGYDLVSPKKEFSVGQYIKLADRMIENIRKRKKTPILVGGTGLYIKSVIDGIPTADIPKNKILRKSLEGRKVDELFHLLAQLAPIRAGTMNVSDRKNPRRLVRAIEIAQWKLKTGIGSKTEKQSLRKEVSALLIGLIASESFLEQRIRRRIKKRLRQGIETEIKKLLKDGVSWESQSMNSLGYKQWRGYFEGKSTKKTVVKEWGREELKYAKRQIAWFKKDRRINWFDISNQGWQKNVEKLVEKWYSSSNASTKKG